MKLYHWHFEDPHVDYIVESDALESARDAVVKEILETQTLDSPFWKHQTLVMIQDPTAVYEPGTPLILF
jgi:hypothetical protein